MKKFSFMFWNVENFYGKAKRTDKVYKHIDCLNPDLFCLCEIKDKAALRSLLMERLTDYDFAVTDGAEGIELLTGWRRGFFNQVLFTQRREFKGDSAWLRPGSLATVNYKGNYFNFLFLHTHSGTDSRAYNNRRDMYRKIWKLKKKLDEITNGGNANFITLGDLNTMGRRADGRSRAISAEEEIKDLQDAAAKVDMRMLSKTHNLTLAWKRRKDEDKYRFSNVDHVLATKSLRFNKVSSNTEQKAEVRVDGWNRLEDPERTKFIKCISDHCSLYAELKVGT